LSPFLILRYFIRSWPMTLTSASPPSDNIIETHLSIPNLAITTFRWVLVTFDFPSPARETAFTTPSRPLDGCRRRRAFGRTILSALVWWADVHGVQLTECRGGKCRICDVDKGQNERYALRLTPPPEIAPLPLPPSFH
jgi:hypothetical protein